MSNLQLFLSLAGFLVAIFAWFRFDINKRFDEQKEWISKRFDDVNRRFDDVNRRFDDVNKRFDDVHKRIDDQNTALAQQFDNINQRFNDLTTFMNKRIDDLYAALKRVACNSPRNL